MTCAGITGELNRQLEGFTVKSTGKTVMTVSRHHIIAADRFAERIRELEKQNRDQPFGEFWNEIFQSAVAVSIFTVASLESYANEISFHQGLTLKYENVCKKPIIEKKRDKCSILNKYNTILKIYGKEPRKGFSEYNEAYNLIQLRNAVVHFHPEWFGSQHEHKELAKKLSRKFQPSIFLPEDPVFPRGWASHSFAEWAFKSTFNFVEYFSQEAGLDNIFSNIGKDLKTFNC